MVTAKTKKIIMKSVEEINRDINNRLEDNLEIYYIPEMQDIIMQTYDAELTGRVTNRKARTNPIFYRDEFEEALQDFEWIESGTDYTKLIVPETNTFNWNQGRLRIVQNIVEGSIGQFIEVDEQQYIAMFNKRPTVQPFDRAVPIKERIYIMRLSGDIRRRWRESFPNRSWVLYPFSNTAPTDLFVEANQYAKDSMQKWINEAIKEITKEVGR